MASLKNSLNKLLFLIFFLSSCASTTPIHGPLPIIPTKIENNYEVTKRDDGIVVINVTPDRILPYCEKLENGNDGFMIMILDEENTVLVATGRQCAHKTCLRWSKKVQDISKGQSSVKFVGLGEIAEERIKEKYNFTFPVHGTFHSNGRSFELHALLNKDKKCFSMFSKACTKGNFALKIDVFQL